MNCEIKVDSQKTMILYMNRLKSCNGKSGGRLKIAEPSCEANVQLDIPFEEEDYDGEFVRPRRRKGGDGRGTQATLATR